MRRRETTEKNVFVKLLKYPIRRHEAISKSRTLSVTFETIASSLPSISWEALWLIQIASTSFRHLQAQLGFWWFSKVILLFITLKIWGKSWAERNSLVARTLRKWQCPWFVGHDSWLFRFSLVDCVVDWFMTSMATAKFAELFQGRNVVFGEKDGWAMIIFAALLIPWVVARICLRMLSLSGTWSHLVKTIRQLTANETSKNLRLVSIDWIGFVKDFHWKSLHDEQVSRRMTRKKNKLTARQCSTVPKLDAQSFCVAWRNSI